MMRLAFWRGFVALLRLCGFEFDHWQLWAVAAYCVVGVSLLEIRATREATA